MSLQNKETNSPAPAEFPMKRKRGRPRKDGNLVQAENIPVIPESDGVRRNQQSEVLQSDDIDDDMVGQVVSGVLEGSFDAGYFLTVKVGNTDSLLRGVVFLPGKFTPITAANDVAPQAKLYKRKEFPNPVLRPQSQLHNSMPLWEQNNRRPVQLENQTPTVSDQVSVTIPLTDNMPKNDSGISLGGQTLEFGLNNQSAFTVAQLEHNRNADQDKILHELEDSTRIKDPKSDIEASKDLILETASEPDVNMLPGNETVSQNSQVQHQSMNADPKPNELVHHEVKSLNLDLHKTPVVNECNSVTPEAITKPTDIPMETLASPKNDVSQDIQSDFAAKILGGDDSSHSNERLASDAANITEAGLASAPKTSQPLMIFQGEAIPSELKLAAEGSNLPGMIMPQVSSSADPTNNMDHGI